MSIDAVLPVVRARRASNGRTTARRAIIRWAWRLFRREWRQQSLILALIVVAVAATIVGSALATNSPQLANFGFGSATDIATYSGHDPHLGSEVAALAHRFGRVEVIENEAFTIPGTIDTFQLRAQSAHGSYSGATLTLASGRFPRSADETAVTAGVASAFHLRVGGLWRHDGTTWHVVGTVENPQSLLDEFALVPPGAVRTPTQVTVLFDAPGVDPSSIGPTVQSRATVAASNVINPQTISIAALVLGMLLIALVSIGGFTVLAQRRLRSLGMLESLGATDKHVSLVVRANGAVVGLLGALVGFVVGVVVWLAYRPSLEQSAHHLIGVFALPWLVVGLSLVLAVFATYLAAARPAHLVTRVPIVAALSGRPAPAKQVHRSALPGIVFLVVAFLLLGYAGAGSGAQPRTPALALGLLCLVPGVILLAPFCLSVIAKIGRRTPIGMRLALRDLSRYRARSGSALAAISLAVLVAMVIAVVAAARYANVLDYAGPNLASNQLVVWGDRGGPGPSGPSATPQQMARTADQIASSLGTNKIAELITTSAGINSTAAGRDWNGPIYLATPQLLAIFGLSESDISPNAEFVSMRPGLSGVSHLQLTYGGEKLGPQVEHGATPCTAQYSCQPDPIIQQLGGLPSGTSAPNTLVTQHTLEKFHLQSSSSPAGWFIETAQPLTAAQINSARLAAAGSGIDLESKNDSPSSSQVIDVATVFALVLALGILGMSVGLIRSETASDLRTLTATGASSRTRRALAAVTAGALGLLGALLGTVGAYVGVIGWIRSSSLNGGISALGAVPLENLVIIIIGMPLLAAIVAWLFAGRESPAVARQPIA